MAKVKASITQTWFPGHMVRSLREMKEILPLIDVVIEVVDARIPYSSGDQAIQTIIQKKPYLMLLSKADLAEESKTQAWLDFLSSHQVTAMAAVIPHLDRPKLFHLIRELHAPKRAKEMTKGIRPRPIRILVCGMPNVGKSSLINQLAKRRAAKVENRPGVTTHLQWVTVEKDFELLDMPGILYPKDLTPERIEKLAFIGMSSHQNWQLVELGERVLRYVLTHRKIDVFSVYRFSSETESLSEIETLLKTHIAQTRGFFRGNNEVDIDRAYEVILNDFRDGKLGRWTLEVPTEVVCPD